MRNFTKIVLSLVMAFGLLGGVNARTVKTLGSPITFAEALVATEPFVLVQDGNVLCCFLSPGYPNDYVTFQPVGEIDNYGYTLGFEKDGTTDNYFIKIYNQAATPSLLGYVNASQWSHSFMASEDNSKNAQKGKDGANGALWTITEVGTKQYAIRNIGVAGGTIGSIATDKGYLKIIPSGYWADHVTIDNVEGPTWQFYTLTTTTLPDEDPVYFGWEDFKVDDGATKDEEKHLVIDTRGYAPYWATSGTWTFTTPFDASNYRYLVFYAKRNISKYGNGDNETGGSLLIKDDNGVTMRQDDYSKYGDPAVDYPSVPSGSFWMNRWGAQRAMVLDLQWLANTDKYGDHSECKAIDIAKIKEIGVAGTFTIGGIFFTNTLPANLAGDYKRSFDSFDKFGTICLPYNAVCCGAQLYEITGKTASGIILTEYEGVMEAGKPYFYKTLEAKKQDGGFKDETDVYFFKAGYATVASPVDNNGLIGTFSEMTAPVGDNYYILSGNVLYNTVGCTGENAVTIGANKAYVDISAISSSPARGVVELDFNEPTGIETVANSQELSANSKFFNLAGQHVAQPTKGLYIVNGKKVLVK